jgi:hypothetical protein
MRSRLVVSLSLLAVSPVVAPLAAQGLRSQIAQLFIFGPGEDPLFLSGSADPSNPTSIQAHGSHYVPSSSSQNGTIIGFLTDAIGGNIANTPIGSTSGGETFRFEGGVPVKTSTSAGPIFAERAMTLGRGRALVGVNYSNFRFTTLRGASLNDLQLNFTHENVDFAGCDAQQGDDCSKMGVPVLENDVIAVKLALDLKVRVTSFYVTYGLTDRLDVSAVVPVVSTSLHGESTAQVIPFGGPTAVHFFGGTPTNPVLTTGRTVLGDATGLGDVAVRAKLRVRDTPRASLALLGEARFATGAVEDLLGAGDFAARGLAVLTSRLGDFSPHANVGYLYRRSLTQNDAVLATGGFDERINDHVTLAADIVSELQVGESTLKLPGTVTYDAPFHRTVTPTQIPDTRDDVVNGSFGFKILPRNDVTLVLNALLPLNRGGLRADRTLTAGVEVTF